jgi:cytochrome oxidase Cu insertion factor (SCO1/SenC/PrrC family)
MDAVMWNREPIGGPFALTDHNGLRRTDADFRGKWLLVYFGYLFCPDICPTDLQAISAAVDGLGASGHMIQPVFITLDPERDTTGRLASYVVSFHPRLIGLTGELSQVAAVARAYRVFYKKVHDERSSDYLMDHSSFIYLIDEAGRYVGFFPPGTTAERMIESIKLHLRSDKRR